ncbi:F-box only protein 44-like [Anneissia japonica]|uniref:F-box only protein 44-like n=1 Tax=Anneissia japonica TaxID=1529436 RepID=UPI0014255CED|nr:F-box only protein 44-like [Anneissia japonica]
MDLQPGLGGLGLSDDESVLEIEINSLPDEILTLILVLVPDECIKHCGLVCCRWSEIVVATTFWKEKCLRKGYILSSLIASYAPNNWKEFYYLKPYSRNLIQNPSGKDGLEKNWTIRRNGGDEWKVEDKTIGAKDKPEELLTVNEGSTENFATSYGWCEMDQVIDLEKEGCSLKLIDDHQPEIYVSEWYTERFDCGCYYELQVQLFAALSDKDPIEEHHFASGLIPQWSDNEWKQVEHTFKNYGKGVRFIRFIHRGKDSQFWAGHYGSKMAGAQVRILIDRPSNVQ